MSNIMGRDLKGREIGTGLSQEKSGLYLVRFVDKTGKRVAKRFKKLQEAKQWYANATYEDKCSNTLYSSMMTVNAWFDRWIAMKNADLKPGTIDSYTARYNVNIRSVIGGLKVVDVKPMHCQMILNSMNETYHNGTIKNVRVVLHNMFEDAKDNGLITLNPMKRSYKCRGGKSKKERAVLNEQEVAQFLEGIEGHRFEIQYRFVLQTGLRTGELIGLKWEDIDFEKRCINIRRTMNYMSSTHSWRSGPPKSQAGRRTVPLTDEAIRLLKMQRIKNDNLKVVPMDAMGYVFIDEKGLIKQGSYYSALTRKLCKKSHIKNISMHILRHTFATRCVMCGMSLKVLQTIMGHSVSSITMDYYVHTTNDAAATELERVFAALNAI